MKRLVFLFVLGISISQMSFAKKVKFSVDMTGQIIAPLGVHVAGNFQTAAGFSGGDYSAGSVEMKKEGDTDIYSVIVDLPAPAMYEYAFVNGDQFYEIEWIPLESRISFDDAYRWINIDNTVPTDTANTEAILFSANAPKDKFLVRLSVDMSNQTVSSNGVYVAGSYQNWDLTKTPMYSFVDKIYEAIVFMPAGMNKYKFYNGNTESNAEIVPTACATDGNRSINITADIINDTVCFASCSSCSPSAITKVQYSNAATLYPSIATISSVLKFAQDQNDYSVIISDISGKKVRNYTGITGNSLTIERGNINSGIYFIQTITSDNVTVSLNKLIFK